MMKRLTVALSLAPFALVGCGSSDSPAAAPTEPSTTPAGVSAPGITVGESDTGASSSYCQAATSGTYVWTGIFIKVTKDSTLKNVVATNIHGVRITQAALLTDVAEGFLLPWKQRTEAFAGHGLMPLAGAQLQAGHSYRAVLKLQVIGPAQAKSFQLNWVTDGQPATAEVPATLTWQKHC